MEEKNEVLGKEFIAEEIQYNVKQEANAIQDYNRLLEYVKSSDLSKATKEIIESEVYEIIGDELNHQERLNMLYTTVTGIKANKD